MSSSVLFASSACALLLALFVAPLFKSFPAPYFSDVAVDISPEALSRLPGNENGPKFPPNLSSGKYARNERLRRAERLFEGKVRGSESVAVFPSSGDLAMIDRYGYVHIASKDLELESNVMYIGPGRPLGFHALEEKNGERVLLVCDSLKCLLCVSLDAGTIEILANSVGDGNEPINYANDLDVASDGTVFFTSSTSGSVALNEHGFYDTLFSCMLNMFRGDKSGRLLAYDPRTRKTRVLMDGFWYANGVSLFPDEQSVAVVETFGFRVLRYYLSGPRAGALETMIDKLPGYPDGITLSQDGNFWVSLVVPLTPLPAKVGPHRLLRQFFVHYFTALQPLIAKAWGCIVKVSPQGEVLDVLMDPDGRTISSVSAVTETSDGRLFLGNLGGDYVSVLPYTPQSSVK